MNKTEKALFVCQIEIIVYNKLKLDRIIDSRFASSGTCAAFYTLTDLF